MGGRAGKWALLLAFLGGCAEIGPIANPPRIGEAPAGPNGPDDVLPDAGGGDGGTVTPAPCDQGDYRWSAPNGSCYFSYRNTWFSWVAGWERCESREADLVLIESAEEQEYVHDFLFEAFEVPAGLWLGGNDRASEGTWRWRDGSLPGYENWGAGQPKNTNGFDDCMVMENDGSWTARFCNDSVHLVCERAPVARE